LRLGEKTVSHVDGTKPEPDPLKLPEDGLLDMMAFDGPATEESPPAESPLAAAAAAEAKAGATEAEERPADRKKKNREKKKKKDRKEKETAGVAPEASGPSFFARISQSSPYTVMLAVALAGLLIGVLLLVLELGSYGFQFSPRK
jgi:hypothetical protein